MNDNKITDIKIARSKRLVEHLSAVLAGHDPDVVGAALVQVTSMYFAGHEPKELRDTLLEHFVEAVRRMVPVDVELRDRGE